VSLYLNFLWFFAVNRVYLRALPIISMEEISVCIIYLLPLNLVHIQFSPFILNVTSEQLAYTPDFQVPVTQA
jgi:hypothetical protein